MTPVSPQNIVSIRRLVSAALPYVNNIPHLGNLVQVLSADVFARFCRLKGYETLYICGTDEYGTATEIKALELGITPQELCDQFYAQHKRIYDFFGLSFDFFGRTSAPEHTQIVQEIAHQVQANGFFEVKETEQFYSSVKKMFLADRYIYGECPYCHYTSARGDQCEKCGKILEPDELIHPYSFFSKDDILEKRLTKHLYLNLPKLEPQLKEWFEKNHEHFAKNAVRMTESWLEKGLESRGITRDLKWGVSVPFEGFEGKVFYVWFDAPLGYISITAQHTPEWKSWWKKEEALKKGKEVEYYQFVGKDNIPFHTITFPATLKATQQEWVLVKNVSSTEYLNYENEKFSKSQGVGVFGNDVQNIGLPVDMWRFYLMSMRPERSDTHFSWSDFFQKVNQELIGNCANLFHRTLSFSFSHTQGKIPASEKESVVWSEIERLEKEIEDDFEHAELKSALKGIFAITALGNRYFQENEPWKLIQTDRAQGEKVIFNILYLLRDLAILLSPFLPHTALLMSEMFILEEGQKDFFSWGSLLKTQGLKGFKAPVPLFKRLEEEEVQSWKEQFSGTQKERFEKSVSSVSMNESLVQKNEGEFSDLEKDFLSKVDLRVAVIEKAEKHETADKLYLLYVTLGASRRLIVSSIADYYTIEQLQGKKIVLVSNLKTAKFRGVVSQGMLLAASSKGNTSTEPSELLEEKVEVIFAPEQVQSGTKILLSRKNKQGERVFSDQMGAEITGESRIEEGSEGGKRELKIDQFFQFPLRLENGEVFLAQSDTQLVFSKEFPLKTTSFSTGTVG